MTRGPAVLLAPVLFVAVLLAALPATAGDLPPPAPDAKCPVCGMFVAKYPEWIATVTFADGHADHFDGAKDMFKYLADLSAYRPGHQGDDVTGVYVTEYYGLERIPAGDAVFVAGSDVLGPMGHEFVPLASAEDATDFVKDHGGVWVLRFDEVTPDKIQAVDHGRFE